MDAPSDSPPPRRSPIGILKAFFTHHVGLRREGSKLNLVMKADVGPSDKPAAKPAAKSTQPADAKTAQMHADLGALLDAAPNSRTVLKPLASIERKLLRHGALIIPDLPATILQPALRQLDGLAVPPIARGVAELRSLLAEAIALHERLERQEAMNQPISSFHVDHKMEVKDASASDFDRAAAD